MKVITDQIRKKYIQVFQQDPLSEFQKRYNETTEQIVTEVLKRYLDRTPSVSDFKDCKRIEVEGLDNEWTLRYKNVTLGKVECIMDVMNYKFTIKFTPPKPTSNGE